MTGAPTHEGSLDGSGLCLAIVVARFNEAITSKLLAGAREAVERYAVAEHEVFWVPGSFELPVVAKRLAESGRYQAVVCLGAVIRHETDHHLYVAGQAAQGIQRVALDSGGHRITRSAASMPAAPGRSLPSGRAGRSR